MRGADVHTAIRIVFYLYFSLMVGLIAYGLLIAGWVAGGGSPEGAPGFAAWFVVVLLFLALLIRMGDQLKRPIRLGRWIALCGVTSVLGVVSAVHAFSLAFCVVCL